MISARPRNFLIPLVFLLAPLVALAQNPTVDTPAGQPEAYDAFIGTTETALITFANPGGASGYGPFVDVIMPTEEGVYLDSATYGPLNLPLIEVPEPGSVPPDYAHPYRKNADGTPIIVTLQPGETLYVMALPYGSLAGDVNPHEIELNIAVQEDAALDVPVPYTVHAGFHSDDAAFTGPGQYGPATVQSVTPRLARLNKTVDAPEAETAVGANFPRTYTISVEVAPGQQLTDLTITDALPNNIVITNIPAQDGWEFTLAGTGSDCGLPADQPGLESGPCDPWTLTATFVGPTPEGAGSTPGSVDFTFDFYVPLFDAAGAPVATGATPDRVVNEASGAADWSDPKSGSGSVSLTSTEHSLRITRNDNGSGGAGDNHDSGIMMIQKYVSTAEAGPGDTVTFTLNFQISDHSAYENVTIEDLLGDGFEYAGGANLTLTQHGQAYDLTPQLTDSSFLASGQQRLLFELTGTTGIPDALLGACVHPTSPDGFAGGCAAGGTAGTLTYDATVLNHYRVLTHGANDNQDVVQGDTLRNDVTVSGGVLNTNPDDYLTPTGIRDNDQSRASVHVPRTAIVKSIVAVNGVSVDPDDPPMISAGDEVTFSLRANLPTSDFRDFFLEDELPTPIFEASEFTPFAASGFPAAHLPAGALPATGTAAFAPTTTFQPSGCPAFTLPSVSVTSSNSVRFDFGDYECAGSQESIIEILLTTTVADVALADAFIINNRLVNGENEQSVATANRLMQFTRPVLNVTKGVIGVQGDSSNPLSLLLPAGATVTSSTNRDDYTADRSGLDANDLVTYAIIIENTGLGTKGAHGVTLTDLLPSALEYEDGTLAAHLGDGTPLGVVGSLFGDGLTFTLNGQPLNLAGVGENGANTLGDNIIVVRYQVRISETVEAWSDLTNTAEVTEYSATPGGENIAGASDGPLSADATLEVSAPAPVKSIVATSEAHTADPSVAVGEVVRYRLTAFVPEGQITEFQLRDVIPSGMRFLNDGTANVAFISNGGLSSSTLAGANLNIAGDEDTPVDSAGVTFQLPASAISNSRTGTGQTFGSGTNVYFKLGTLINADSDTNRELVIVEFNALILNGTADGSADDAGSDGQNRNNRFRLYSAAHGNEYIQSNQARVTIREPDLVIEKSVLPGSEVVAGDTATYTVDITNDGSATAFNVNITDPLSSWLEDVSVTGGASYDAVEHAVTYGPVTMNPGATVTFTITATLLEDTPTGETILNTAGASYTSLPGTHGTTGNDTGSDTPGDTGEWDGAREYTSEGNVSFTTTAVAPSKQLIATSEAHTTGSDVAIGEVVRYALSVSVPKGDSLGFTITDALPAGLQFIDVGGANNQVTLAAEGAGLQFITTPGLGAALGAQIELPAAQIEVVGQSATFTLGDLHYPPTAAGEANVTIEFNALVLNVPTSTHGVALDNSFTVIANGRERVSNVERVNVVEPAITVEKRVIEPTTGLLDATGDASGVDLGDVVTFQVSIANSGAAAFEIGLTDELPAGFTPLAGSAVVAPAASYAAEFAGQTLTLTPTVGTSLTASDTITVTYQATVTGALGNGEELTNTAIASASSLPGPSGTSTNDTGSTTPGGTGETDGERAYSGEDSADMQDSATTKVGEPELTITKSVPAGGITNHADGSYTITFELSVTNTGDIDLIGVQLHDDLAATFTAAPPITITDAAVISATGGTPNASFDGGTDTAVFASPVALAVDETATATISATVNLTALEHPGEFTNVATGEGHTPGGLTPEEPSSPPTTFELGEAPQLDVLKSIPADGVINQGDGTYLLTYHLTLTNSGDVDLRNVQATDDISALYGAVGTATLVGLELVDPANPDPALLVLNTAYDGVNDTQLLSPTSVLPVGAAQTVAVTLNAEPISITEPYENVVNASAESPTGNPVTDEDSIRHPMDENPLVGISTSLVANDPGDDAGEYYLTFDIFLKNYGNVELSGLQAALDLADIFGDAALFEFVSLVSDDPSLPHNPGFNGESDTSLLAAGGTLHTEGQNAEDGTLPHELTLTLVVRVVPGSTLYYELTSQVEGTSPFGTPATDDSNDGGDPDVGGGADNDDDPTNNTAPTPVEFPLEPGVALAKRVSALAVADPADPAWFLIEFTFEMQNTGNVPLTAVSLQDGLADAFADGSQYEIQSITATAPLVAAGDLTAATATGELLSPASQLGTAASAALPTTHDAHQLDRGSVTLALRVIPTDPSDSYENSATITGTPAGGGQPVTDVSNDGETPTEGTDEPTLFTFETPIIGLAKAAPATFDFGDGLEANPRHDAAGEYQVGYVFTLVNYGDVPLSDLSLTDDVMAQLAAGNPVSAHALDGTLDANPAWDGSDPAVNILAPGQTLGYSLDSLTTGTVHVVVALQPGAALASGTLTLQNDAEVAGTSPGGNRVSDDSANGTDPDPDGNGDPTDDGSPTTVTLQEGPAIALAKAMTGLENLTDGVYRVTFTLTVQNTGDVDLTDVQVIDDLNAAFRGVPLTVEEVSATAPLTAASSSVAEVSGELLVASASSLASGESATITVAVVIEPGDEIYEGPFHNSAHASGTSPAGTEVVDTSNDGLTPQPGDDTPTPIVLDEDPVLGVAKAATVTALGDGCYDVQFTFTIRNYGNVELRQLQLLEDLTEAFGAGTTEVLSLYSPTLSVNKVAPDPGYPEAFDGEAHHELLTGVDTLAVGETGTVELVVRVAPLSLETHYNQVRATGVSPGGIMVLDDSTDGLDPDASDEPTNSAGEPTESGDGNPNEDTPTPVPFGEDPVIGVAKQAEVIPHSDGTFDVLLTFTIRNYGDVPLSGVRLTDSLANVYAITDLTPERVSVQSATLTVNHDYDGQADVEILTGVDALAVNEAGRVTVRLASLTPTGGTSTTNTAVAHGTSPHGTEVSDSSQDGLDPDPDGDGDPTNDNDPTPIDLAVNPQIALAKSASLTQDDDGTFTVVFTLNVLNSGNTPLLGVQVEDDLADYWANTDLAPERVSVESATLNVNPAYDGQTDARILRGTDTLAVGQAAELTVTLTGLSVTGETTLQNSALASGTSPTGTRVTDRSNDGTEPEPGLDDPTITPLEPRPLIGIAKSAAVVAEVDGTFTVTFTLTLANYGNTNLTNLRVQDSLSEFYTDASLSAAGVSVSSEGLPVNPDYDGLTDTELLGSGATLAVGETKSLTVTLTELLPLERTSFTNQASGGGEGPDGTPTPPERSTNGDDPDPDDDGDPTNDSEPTPVELALTPLLGVSKSAAVTQQEEGGAYRVTFTIGLTNMGNATLTNVQLVDDLSDFYAGTDLSSERVSISSSELPVNPGYDGLSDVGLLVPGGTLAPGERATVTLVLAAVSPVSETHFLNSALARGQAPDGSEVEDRSQDGTDPDPDQDGDPTNDNDPTPVVLEPEPLIGIAKRATVSGNEDGSFDLTLDFVVGNYGNTMLHRVQVRDSLRNLYGATNLTPEMIRLTSPGFTINAAYDGDNDQYFLTGEDSLAVGASGTIQMVISGLVVTESVYTTNTAVATGEDGSGTPAPPDRSQDGDDPDPDEDGDPTNDNDPTPIALPGRALLGVSKHATLQALEGGAYDVTFTLVLRNYGNVPLSNLSLIDDLSEFYEHTDLTAGGVRTSSADLALNPGFDGVSDTELLAGGNTLGVGTTAQLTITLASVTPNPGVTTLHNSALGTGTTPNGGTVTDTSQDGENPDPDGDGDPTNNSDPTPVIFEGHTTVLLDKRAAAGPYQVGDRVPYTVTVHNPNDVAVSVNLVDAIPEGTAYITGTAAFEPETASPGASAEPRVNEEGTTLEWSSVVIPAGERVTLTYSLRVLPGAVGGLTNTVTVDGEALGGAPLSATANERVIVQGGVFDQTRGLLIGRVYLDVNGDNAYTEGVDVPLKDARVVLGNGWQVRTDEQGNYAFRDLETGTWTVQVDEITAPYAPNPHPEQLRDPRQHKVHVQGLAVSDFPFEPLTGLTGVRRETTVTYGPVQLHKYLLTIPDGTRVVLTITSSAETHEIIIRDGEADGTERTFRVTPTTERQVLTYDLPRGAQLTDPFIQWSNQ